MKLSFSSKNQPEIPLQPDIVLASQSVGRRTLLEKLGLRFRVAVTRVDEDKIVDANPVKTIQKRAAAKAAEVVNNPRIYMIPEDRDVVVITADSEAIVGKKSTASPWTARMRPGCLKNSWAKPIPLRPP